jgi:CRP-like cAMP-binding protein
VIDKHLLKLRARDEVGEAEEAAIRGALGVVKTYPADKVVIAAGEEVTCSTLLLEGMMSRFKDLRDGERQISGLHVAGDFLDLHSFTLKHLDHGILSLTPCKVVLVPHEELTRITEEFPHLTRIYWFSTNLDACIHREWEVSLGRRSGLARTAHLFCELRVRLGIVGLADDSGYDLQLTQAELGECLGLTPVHVNRMLRELRERGLVEFRGKRVAILDYEGLKQVADFDPAYLYLDRRAR